MNTLKTSEAALSLDITSPDTVKNWLEGGAFPGSTKTPDGDWQFAQKAVEAVKARMSWIRERNAKGELSLPEIDNKSEET